MTIRPLTRGGTPRRCENASTIVHVATQPSTLTLNLWNMTDEECDATVRVTSRVGRVACLSTVEEHPNVGDVLCTEDGTEVGVFVGAGDDPRTVRVVRTNERVDIVGGRLFACNCDGVSGRPKFHDPQLGPREPVQFVGDVTSEERAEVPAEHDIGVRLQRGMKTAVLSTNPLGPGVVVSVQQQSPSSGLAYTGFLAL
jgi:hypothetical protein